MKNVIILLMVLMCGLSVTPKYAFTDEDPWEFADIHIAPIFNSGLLGPFGGYMGGSGDWSDVLTAMDWSVGNTVPLSPIATDDMVFSTTIGSWVNPADWVERMRITKGGNVGIGTANPETPLHLVTSVTAPVFPISIDNITNNATGPAIEQRKARGAPGSELIVNNGDLIGGILRFGYDGSSYVLGTMVRSAVDGTPSSGSMPARIEFRTNDGSSVAERMRITKDGKVGIGTTSPQVQLHVSGRSGEGLPVFDTETQLVINNNATGTDEVGIALISGSSETSLNGGSFIDFGDFSNAEKGSIFFLNSAAQMGFEINGETRMVINNSGNIGIGTGDPKGKIDIAGGVSIGTYAGVNTPPTNGVIISGAVGVGTTNPQGKMDINGSIYQRGSLLSADYVFDSDYKLESIEEHAGFMWKNKHLKAIPKSKIDENGMEIVEIGSYRKGIVEELEKAHIYIEQLKDENEAIIKHNHALESRLTKLEARLNGE